jgi:autotransporter-associated beta strand protein
MDQNDAETLTTKRLNDSNTRIAYLRFDLSLFDAAPEDVSLVTLQLQLTGGGVAGDTLKIFGLNDGALGNDGITSETNWTNVLVWNNQPAGTVANAVAALPNANTVDLLDSPLAFDTATGIKTFSISLTKFQSFLGGDTNDQLTLLFVNTANANPTWASATNTGGNLKPTLHLEYTPSVPPTGHLWNGASPLNNNWTTGANWADGLPAAAGQTLEFGGTTRLTPNDDLPAGTSIGGLIFNSTAGEFVLGGNNVTLGGDINVLSTNLQTVNFGMVLSADSQFDVKSGGQLVVNGEISGGFGVTKSGGGTLVLNSPNTYTGGTTLNSGTLQIGVANALGSIANVTINGGSLDTNGNSIAFGTLSGTGGTITNSSTVPVTLTVGAGDATSTYAGSIQNGSATTSLVKTGSGAQTFAITNNSFTGGVTINSGTLIVSGAAGNTALGKGDVTILAGGTLTGANQDAFGFTPGTNNAPATIFINGGTVTDLGTGNYRVTLPNLVFTGGLLTSAPGNNGDANGNYSFNGDNSTFTLTTNPSATTALINAGVIAVQKPTTLDVASGTTPSSVDLTISSVLRSFGTGTAPFTKTGAGVLSLTGANTYLGATTVNGGRLLVGDGVSGSLNGTASVTVNIGGTLGGSGSIAPAADGSVILNAGAFLEPGHLGVGTLTVAVTGAGQFDLSGAAGITDAGAFNFQLGASQAASDSVLLSAGALLIGTDVLEFDDFIFTDAGGAASGTYTLFDTANPIIGTLGANVSGGLGGGFFGTLAFADGGNDLVLIVVPEPGTGIASLLGGAVLLGFRRSRSAARRRS